MKLASMHLTLHLALKATLRHTSSDQIPKGELLPHSEEAQRREATHM